MDGECLLRGTTGAVKCRLGEKVVAVSRKLFWIEDHECQET